MTGEERNSQISQTHPKIIDLQCSTPATLRTLCYAKFRKIMNYDRKRNDCVGCPSEKECYMSETSAIQDKVGE